MNSKPPSQRHFLDVLWDLWCIVSVIGIWPRFIEPNLIETTRLTRQIPNLPDDLKGFKILQFSDLHLHRQVSSSFLQKIVKKTQDLKPDLIVFTGDFLCYSEVRDRIRLKDFLNQFDAPYGCYAILGNHDYNECVSINSKGEYDILKRDSADIWKGFKRLAKTIKLTGVKTQAVLDVKENEELINLLKETPFRLLHNETDVIHVGQTKLNICGVGEYILGKMKPEKAFEHYQTEFPGIILAHNPDAAPHLVPYPGDVILSGHTHGGQVNLPGFRNKFILLENMDLKKGLCKIDGKWLYVNRGIGSTFPFRWFSRPELVLLTLENKT